MSNDEALFLREQALRLRRVADDLDQRALNIERGMHDRDVLRGRSISDAAVQVFRNGETLHYRDILALVEQTTGKRVYGHKPEATLLTALSRDERLERIDGHTGEFRLAPASTSRGES
jgi:hypothetical protein